MEGDFLFPIISSINITSQRMRNVELSTSHKFLSFQSVTDCG